MLCNFYLNHNKYSTGLLLKFWNGLQIFGILCLASVMSEKWVMMSYVFVV